MIGAEVPVHRVSSTGGVDLALHHFGGTGPTLVICHATGFHAVTYRPLLPILTSAFDVWGLDLRGHGSSTAPADGDFDWSGFVDDLSAAIDHIGVPSVRAVGHSMGATTILLTSKRRPDVISAAWLFEPIVFSAQAPPRNSIMAAAAIKRRAEFPSRAEALERFASRPPLSRLRADALAAYVDGGFVDTPTGAVTLACRPEHEAATFENACITVDDIDGLPLRVLIAASPPPPDEPSAARYARASAAVLPNSTFVEYPAVSHFGPLEIPDLFAADIVDFLA